MPIPVPSGVEIEILDAHVRVKGPKGELERDIPADIEIVRDADVLVVKRPSDEPRIRSLHGLTRSLVANMVVGVSEGFRKELEIHGVGYRAASKGSGIELQVGYSHPVQVDPPTGIMFDVPEPTRVVVQGTDKQLVGQVAADIRKIRKPEPYKGKGIRYVGEYVRRKAGKTGVAGAV